MIRQDMMTISEKQTYPTFARAKKRKLKLRDEGWRVKIRKGPDGRYQIWKKHIEIIDVQNHMRFRANMGPRHKRYGNGRAAL